MGNLKNGLFLYIIGKSESETPSTSYRTLLIFRAEVLPYQSCGLGPWWNNSSRSNTITVVFCVEMPRVQSEESTLKTLRCDSCQLLVQTLGVHIEWFCLTLFKMNIEFIYY